MADRWSFPAAVAVALALTCPPLHGQPAPEKPHHHAGRHTEEANPAEKEAVSTAVGAGYFGFIVDDLDTSDRGIDVLRVHPGGPADRVGLRAGDRIELIDGHPVRNMANLEQIVRTSRPGDRLRLSATRNGEPHEIAIILGKRPVESQRLLPHFGKIPAPAEREVTDADRDRRHGRLGLRLAPLTEAIRRRLNVPGAGGVLVDSVRVGSSADQAGISAGSVVLSIDGRQLRSLDEAHRALADVGSRHSVTVTLFDRGELIRAELQETGTRVESTDAKGGDRPATTASANPPSDAGTHAPDARPATVRQLESRIEAIERRIDALERGGRNRQHEP